MRPVAGSDGDPRRRGSLFVGGIPKRAGPDRMRRASRVLAKRNERWSSASRFFDPPDVDAAFAQAAAIAATWHVVAPPP